MNDCYIIELAKLHRQINASRIPLMQLGGY